MWPLPPIKDDIVAIVVEDTALHCGWLIPSSKQEINLKALQTYPLSSANSTSVRRHLTEFVNRHQLAGAFFSAALSTPLVHEEFITLTKASATPADLINPALARLLWEYQYLHPLENGNHIFYVHGLKKSTLAEYQILARHVGLSFTGVTSAGLAHLQAYALAQGTQVRRAQLALDLARAHYQIDHCYAPALLMRFIKLTQALEHQETQLPLVAQMLGLYQLEKGLRL